MNFLPQSWRRSIHSLFAIGCFSLSSTAWSADFTVNNNNDAGAGSLRNALIQANAAGAESHYILFQLGLAGTISQATPLPTVANNVNIFGPGSGVLTVNGNSTTRVFFVDSGNVLISSLNIDQGKVAAGNGRIGGGEAGKGGNSSGTAGAGGGGAVGNAENASLLGGSGGGGANGNSGNTSGGGATGGGGLNGSSGNVTRVGSSSFERFQMD